MEQVTLFQAAHFVLEPQSQQACKIDELVHGLLLRDSRGCGVSMSGDTARLNKLHTHTYQVIEAELAQ